MNFYLYINLLGAVFFYYAAIITLLRKNQLKLKYTLLWLIIGLIMLLLILFPNILFTFTKIIGIFDPLNGLFAIVLFLIILLLISITAIVSKLSENNKRLVQIISLQDERIRKLESEN